MIDKLRKIISENIFVEMENLEKLSSNDKLTNIGLDSINLIYIIGEIEEQFGFNFIDEELFLENFETLEKISDLINKRKNVNIDDSRIKK
ncbi:acyl carrier protein [Clostridium sporogenes]|uniref:acyl carrier protein n=1 Tax=Clostridium sporogenes TaxID=1509 RepID=UPI002237A5F8|nr:acyl carrier protein [Clostridium sporogenes]MCW6109103.1 acyl carrier protein [Clostridium sporogenes]